MIIGNGHGLVQINSGMTLDFSYFGTKISFSNFSCRKQTRISMCLTLGVTILSWTTEIQLVLYYQCTVGAPVWIAKYSIYLLIALFFLKSLCVHIIYPSVDSEATAGWIYNFQQIETPNRVWIIPETDRLLLIILSWSTYWWHSKLFCVV